MKITSSPPITFKFKSNDNGYPKNQYQLYVKMDPFISTVKHFKNKNNNIEDDEITKEGFKNVKRGLFISASLGILSPIITAIASYKNKEKFF